MKNFLKADLHLHTNEDPIDSGFVNYDAFGLIDIVKKKGFDVIAITNHDYMADINELNEYANMRDIVLIPGIEKTIEGKHVIFLNADTDTISKVKNFEDIKYIKRNQTLVIAPHPFFPHRDSINSALKRYVKYFDAIEYSGYYFKYINFSKKAKIFAIKYCLPIIGSSDAHRETQIGRTYTVIESERNVNSIINAIKSNKVRLITEPLPVNLENIFLSSLAIKLALSLYFKKKSYENPFNSSKNS